MSPVLMSPVLMSPVLVTGGSGYLGTQLIAALLRNGRQVRATVRSLEREGDVRAAVRRGDADDSRLEVVTAELTADEGWAAAVAGCEEVHHVASPMIQSDDPDEVIVPGPEPPRLIIHNDRAKRELGWRPRPAETTIVETAESLRDLGLLAPLD